ncbi:MAG: hypothetical protein AAF709_07820, partial [Pseudomonadota bacterium]
MKHDEQLQSDQFDDLEFEPKTPTDEVVSGLELDDHETRKPRRAMSMKELRDRRSQVKYVPGATPTEIAELKRQRDEI